MFPGSQDERAMIRDKLYWSQNSVDILIASYSTLSNKMDRSFFRKFAPNIVVVDEAHSLKNRKSGRYNHVVSLKACVSVSL